MTVEQLDAYEVIEKREIKDVKSMSYILKHKKSGARVALLSNDDKNKVFYVGFRTPPTDSTGVAHILEHSVLCGSKNFPLKDPFVELAKGSLNTFLNAMTYPDKTVYPVASCNDKDFQNLMKVYMDAVLYPNIYKEEKIFRQEGWHYEMESTDDELKLNGVVYNEMKGVFSSPDDVVERKIMDAMFPEHTYGLESGGDPEVIPTLTYEDFLQFHSRYYHPCNSYIYLYGDMDMAEKLDFLDKEYLSNFDAISLDSRIAQPKPFTEFKEIKAQYSVMTKEELKEGTYLALSSFAGEPVNKEHYYAFPILDYAICTSSGAPLRKALIDKGIGDDVYSSLEMGIAQPYYAIIAKDTDEDRKEEFHKTIQETLSKLVTEGLDKKALLAGLNVFEFQYREADFGSYPKGLAYGLDMLDSWLYADEMVFDYVEANDIYKKMRQLIDTDYFENLIKTYLLDENKQAMIVASPKLQMAEEKEKKMAESLQQYKSTLSMDEIEKIVENTKALKAYQEQEDTPENLAKIPLLTRADIDKKALKFFNELRQVQETNVLCHPIFTNQIAYVRFMYDMTDMPAKLFPYVGIFKNILGLMDTEHYSYGDLFNEIHTQTGGMGVVTNFFQNAKNSEEYKITFEVKAKMLTDHMGPAFAIVEEMMLHTKYDDKKRLRELLNEMKSKEQASFISSGHSVAAGRAMSYFSINSAVSEEIKGMTHYRFLEHLTEHFDEEYDALVAGLKAVHKFLFAKQRLMVDYTGEMKDFEKMPQYISAILDKLADEKTSNEKTFGENTSGKKYVPVIEPKNEGFKTAGQVQYVCRAGNFKNHGLPYTGVLKVLRVMLGYDYLWMNVRVKGGAYGCMCNFSRNGDSYFVSYRDPNLEKTVEVYKKTADYLKNYKADERTIMQYIIGTISDLDTPLSPSAYGTYSMGGYLSGLTDEDIQKERDEILAVTESDIQGLSKYMEAFMSDRYICVVGTAKEIEKNKGMFGATENLFQ